MINQAACRSIMLTATLLTSLVASSCAAESDVKPEAKPTSEKVRLKLWGRGVSLTAPDNPEMTLHYWFYEWGVFDAFAAGHQAPGPESVEMKLSEDEETAWLSAPGILLTVQAQTDGASLTLEITNKTEQAWPAAAGIIPCLNPGDPPEVELKKNTRMLDLEQTRTWFIGGKGEENLVGRDLHFIESKLDAVRARAPEGMTNLFAKWPVSPVNAVEGVLFRESSDGAWVGGVGWEDVVFVQGHNPWKCMHVCVGVGPLAPNESRTVRGKIWLFRGARGEAMQAYKREINTE